MDVFAITLCILVCFTSLGASERSFVVDYPNDRFLKDGKPFQYVSGSLHYFRVLPSSWRDRLTKYRAAGLNVVETYIEWSSHEPEPGVYNFTGINDIVNFLTIAQDVGLLVVLRPGPFIDAERDMGGFPYWLMRQNPKVNLRTSDPNYLYFVNRWYSVLLPKIEPLLYQNGGPIITVQVENEYGWLAGQCDNQYMADLRDMTRKYLGNDVVLFTNDGPVDSALRCSKTDDILAALDFGPGSNLTATLATKRVHQEHGPFVNAEYYPGWLDHWEETHSTKATKDICLTLDQMLAMNGSISFYMFHGGTNFGFTAGSNGDSNSFTPCPTSYDYDAPLSEAGDPTDKYFAIRDVIGKYFPLPNIPLPKPAPKMELPAINLQSVANLFDSTLNSLTGDPVTSQYPLTFDDLKQRDGFVRYSTTINVKPSDPALLQVPGLFDRALVFVNSQYQGTLSRTRKIYQMPLNARKGSQLDILVENQGRIAIGSLSEFRGITSNVTLGPITLQNWNHYRLFPDWENAISKIEKFATTQTTSSTVPSFYVATFKLPNSPDLPLDTFLRLDGWSKGVAFLNGFNLGRYWPIVGPQETLYAPAVLFNPYPQDNTLTVFELENSPCPGSCSVQFVKKPVVNGTVPWQ